MVFFLSLCVCVLRCLFDHCHSALDAFTFTFRRNCWLLMLNFFLDYSSAGCTHNIQLHCFTKVLFFSVFSSLFIKYAAYYARQTSRIRLCINCVLECRLNCKRRRNEMKKKVHPWIVGNLYNSIWHLALRN